jgi:hypothetical protein
VQRQTSFQVNAGEYATIAETAIDAERHAASRNAVQLLLAGRRGRAHHELLRSVQRQARIAGLGDILQLPCPCGGRCRG